MAALEQNLVFQSLSSSLNARLLRGAELGDELAAALWTNHHDARDYQGPGHHTLSCYLAGGTGTFRRERPSAKGSPDKLCVLPAR
jgi:AraC family transcriptional regulator